MPLKFWKHQCPGRSPHWTADSTPCGCGNPKVYDGWHNSRFEAMAWYQKRHGLKPIGSHRALADRLFKGASAVCTACSGRGYFDAAGGISFEPCDKCCGAGHSLTISADRHSALRAQVLAMFPDACARSNLPDPAFSTMVHDLDSGEIVVVGPGLAS
jgi:hypothetical protein